MKTMADVLRDADPLGDEPERGERERRLSRQRVLDAPLPPQAVRAMPRRAFAITMVAGLVGVIAAAGYWSRAAVDVVAAVRFDVRLAEENPGPGLRAAAVSGRTIYLHEETVLTNSGIATAQLVEGSTASTFGVAVTFTADGAARMARASGSHVGKPLAILIDGEVVMAPVIRSAIGASAVISGSFTRAEAERIVAGVVGR
jgi:hypothetical protein